MMIRIIKHIIIMMIVIVMHSLIIESATLQAQVPIEKDNIYLKSFVLGWQELQRNGYSERSSMKALSQFSEEQLPYMSSVIRKLVNGEASGGTVESDEIDHKYKEVILEADMVVQANTISLERQIAKLHGKQKEMLSRIEDTQERLNSLDVLLNSPGAGIPRQIESIYDLINHILEDHKIGIELKQQLLKTLLNGVTLNSLPLGTLVSNIYGFMWKLDGVHSDVRRQLKSSSSNPERLKMQLEVFKGKTDHVNTVSSEILGLVADHIPIVGTGYGITDLISKVIKKRLSCKLVKEKSGKSSKNLTKLINFIKEHRKELDSFVRDETKTLNDAIQTEIMVLKRLIKSIRDTMRSESRIHIDTPTTDLKIR